VAAEGAHAAAWAVNKTNDTPVGQACPGFTNCSLREAITSTELNPGPDSILVSEGTYTLANGKLTVTQDLTVAKVGTGEATIDGSDASRIFDITGSGTDFVLRFLTLTNGRVSGAGPSHGGAVQGASGTTISIQSTTISNSSVDADTDAEGGAIYSDGPVTISTASGSTTGSSITGNSATATQATGLARGGGLAVQNTLTVDPRTSISLNAATGQDTDSSAIGGGVYAGGSSSFTQASVAGNTATGGTAEGGGVTAGAAATFVRSTVSGNTATTTADSTTGGGGGVAVDPVGSGSVDLQFSTVSGNSATTTGTSSLVVGGGVASFATGTGGNATNSTISSNTVSASAGSTASGPGLYGSGLGFTLGGTILAENGTGSDPQCDTSPITSNGYNVLGPLGTCTYSAGTGDVTGVADAGLKPLASAGGLTRTMLLVSTSPALDLVPAADTLCTASATDQRGVSRPQGGSCDSGSVEMRPATLVISPDPKDLGLATLSTPATGSVTVSNTGELDTAAPTPSVAAPFAASGCTSAIDAGTSCTLDLEFAPAAGGRLSRVLQLTSGSVSGTATLRGIGWAPTTPPQVRGTPSVGYQASVATGRWPASHPTFTAQWRRCDADGTSNCGDISGATGSGYRPVLADAGHTLRVVLTARTSGGLDSDPVTTAPSPVVTRTVPTLIQAPAVDRGSAPVVGTVLSAYRGQWTGAPDSYAFQWVRCDADGTSNCAGISGRTRNRYTPVADDSGHTLRVRVVATNPAGTSARATSAPTGVVS
jgi:hypothetical protein